MIHCRTKTGKERLLEHYRRIFRTPENLNHYSPEDYKLAERKFLKCFVLGSESDTDRKSPEKIGRIRLPSYSGKRWHATK